MAFKHEKVSQPWEDLIIFIGKFLSKHCNMNRKCDVSGKGENVSPQKKNLCYVNSHLSLSVITNHNLPSII